MNLADLGEVFHGCLVVLLADEWDSSDAELFRLD